MASRRARIRFGPAGWSYKDWDGIVYPRPKPRGFDPLEFLSAYFDTIEVNSTFYRPMAAQVAKSWADRVAANKRFQFTAKLWRRFTHQREAWSSSEVKEARAGMDALMREKRLGAVLLQFPWSFRRTDENREWLDALSKEFEDLPLVVEIRHASWNVPEFFETLHERGIGFVNIDQPLFANSIKPTALATSQVAYVRVHGRNYQQWFRQNAEAHERYDYLYTARELQPWAERIEELSEAPRTKEIYVVTNNHFRGKAPINALMLEAMVRGETTRAPGSLVEEYRSVAQGLVHGESAAVQEELGGLHS